MSGTQEPVPGGPAPRDDRRDFLRTATSTAMVSGLAAGYGTAAVMAGRFLFPASGTEVSWQFVTALDHLRPGDSLTYLAPSGATIVVARQGEGATADDFIALSSVCPHLGCKVHWESVNNRFFCPCHNGVFNPQGLPMDGPPKRANQSLARYPLRVDGGLLYIEVPVSRLPTEPTV